MDLRDSVLADRSFRDLADAGDILQQFGRDAVPLCQILRRVEHDRYQFVRVFGRSSAELGDAIITGVPALGLPKSKATVCGMLMPLRPASPLKSIFANNCKPLACRMFSSFATVSEKL